LAAFGLVAIFWAGFGRNRLCGSRVDGQGDFGSYGSRGRSLVGIFRRNCRGDNGIRYIGPPKTSPELEKSDTVTLTKGTR
jgi:hypothetical protein